MELTSNGDEGGGGGDLTLLGPGVTMALVPPKVLLNLQKNRINNF